MRKTISVISLLIAIGIAAWLIVKAGIGTITYILGFAIAIGLAFLSGYAINSISNNPELQAAHDKLTDTYNELCKRFQALQDEYDRGRAGAPQPQAAQVAQPQAAQIIPQVSVMATPVSNGTGHV